MKRVVRRRLLLYGEVELIPVASITQDLWSVPGGVKMTTRELVRLADIRGVQVVLSTASRDGRTLQRLN